LLCLSVNRSEATLGDYWCCDCVCQKYAAAQVTAPERKFFLEPISAFLVDLSNESLSYPKIGLLYGYPVEESDNRVGDHLVHSQL
jgi:hypothetical protein